MPSKKGKRVKSKGSKKTSKASKSEEPQTTPEATPSLPLAPVQRCPEDVLFIIFELYLAETDPSYIRRLLLVCRQWHNLAMNAPQLWTHITFSIPSVYEWEPTPPKRIFDTSVMPFVKACLKHAGSSLLHVNIWLLSLMSEEEWSNHMKHADFDSDFFDFDQPNSIEFSGWDGYLSIEDVQSGLSLITGKNGSAMKRWSSLDLVLPSTFDEEGTHGLQLLRVLTGPTPNLIRLSISGADSLWEISGGCKVLPILSSLRYLDFEEAIDQADMGDNDLHLPSLLKAPLEHLFVAMQSGSRDWPALCRLVSLRTLKFYHSIHPVSHSHTHVMPALKLPHLETITFDGDYVKLGSTKFDFPSLEHICFRPRSAESFTEFPLVQPKSVKWDAPFNLKDWRCQDIEGAFRVILLQYLDIDWFEIPASTEAACRKVIGQLKQENAWSSKLKHVRLFSEKKGPKVLDVDSL